jgi:chromosome segregation ATPase
MRGALLLALAAAVTPVQKVIQLLQQMAEKGKAAKEEEQVLFAEDMQWCEDTSAEKQRAIDGANSEMDQLTASIQMEKASADELGHEITVLDGESSTWEGDRKAATQVREKEAADYAAAHKDYVETLDALDRAIAILQRQDYDRAQAKDALAQVKIALPVAASRIITSFLAHGDVMEEDPLSVVAPEADAYEFQSGGVVGMLKQLKGKFEDEKTALEKAEMEAKHAYEMVVHDLEAQLTASASERSRKATSKSTHLKTAAQAQSSLQATQRTRDGDAAFLADVSSQCRLESSDFEARQKVRTEELAALEQALSILGSDTVRGNAEKHLPSLAQTSLAFLRSSAQDSVLPVQERVANYLRRRGKKVNSNILLAVAGRMTQDPFEKVKKLIKDLIVRLIEEANEESEHKGWCDGELATNAETRNAKAVQVENLQSEIEELQATIAQLGQELMQTSEEIQDLSRAIKEATAERMKQKAANEATVTDAKEAQNAVAKAMEVLKAFYGNVESFVQQPALPSANGGMQSESGGVIGMLEVIQEDFSRLEAATSAAEAEGEQEFKKFTKESAVNQAQLTKDVEHKEKKKTDVEGDLTTAQGDLKDVQTELDAALSYYEKLKPSCIDAGVSYDDRVARRQEEIESLQEALRILSGEDLA